MKVAVLGDGILGSEICNQTGWDCISRKKSGFDAISSRLSDYLIQSEHGAVFYSKYDVVVNCIAFTDTYSDNRDMHMLVNYDFVARLSDFCQEHKIKLVHISTEYVYANNKYPPLETELPIPHESYYAKYKLLADHYVSMFCDDHLICRLLHKSNDFNPEKVWDCKTSGDKSSKISELVVSLVNQGCYGIFNVGTGDKTFKSISPDSSLTSPPIKVPTDTRMNIEKIKNVLSRSKGV